MKSNTNNKRQGNKQPKHRINHEIRATQVRLIGSDGILIGVKPINDALRMAELKNLDLVETVPNSNPPVCRIIEYGKFLYEIQKKEKDQKKKVTQQLLKEIRFKWRTDTHDFNFKVKHARTFIEEGNKVKASVTFRGREITHSEIGKELLEKFTDALKDIAKVDQNYRMDNKNMSIIMSPIKMPEKTKKPKTEQKVSDTKEIDNVETNKQKDNNEQD